MTLTNFWLVVLLVSVSTVAETAKRKKVRVLPKAKKPDSKLINLDGRKADCSEVTKRRNGVFRICPDGTKAKQIKVYCDMETDGGGWTVFQRRKNGGLDFHRMWIEYKRGFGRLAKTSEFWLGNDNIHLLTVNRSISLRVELESWRNPHTKFHATYQHFSVGDEKSNYKLEVSGYGGTPGNALSYHNSMPFSTEDEDNEPSSRNYATVYRGGWWFNTCLIFNLNGKYLEKETTHGQGIVWFKGKLKFKSLKFTPCQLDIRVMLTLSKGNN